MYKLFKRPITKTISIVIVAITLSTIVNSYYRNIQEFIHGGLVEIWDEYPTIAEALYEVNGVVFNGKSFDQERKAKRTIYDGFGSVVIISVTAPDTPALAGRSGRGTGFIIEVDGDTAIIVTNHHVVDSAINQPDTFNVNVNTAGSHWVYEATIIGNDPVSDIAVLSITKQDNEDWEAVKFADNDSYSTGTPVVVIGHGMSMSWTSTQGHVVYKDRYGMRPYNLMVQVDAVINQGNSGGPVFNLDGDVIGVAQSIYSPGRDVPGWDGVGMAISASQAKRSVDYIRSPQYSAKGYVPYIEFPFALGSFKLEDVKDIEKEDRHYAFFDYPAAGAPIPGQKVPVKTVGELAGIQQGDILIDINGEEISSSFTVLRMVLKAFPGDVWTVTVQRGEETVVIDVAMREVDIEKLHASLDRKPGPDGPK